ncbi:MAG: Gfo/Idh/MocA family oxidoreductase [Planctomycetota bacterium]|nr:Gfo/Idh/MocA family oxidoreductase [Planctomycetota bacterium]
MTTPSGVIRVALVGCGDIAQTGHVPALLAHPRFHLVELCDVRPARTELLSKLAGGVPTSNDFRTLLTRDDVDAVILALHPEISVDVAIAFLQAGKAVLDEKPLATNLDDGRRLVRAVAAARAPAPGVYQIGFVFSYCDLVRDVARWAARIGSPSLCHVGVFDERLDRANTEHFGRIQQILRHSSAVTHEGSHVVDFYRFWNSAPYVRAQASAMRTEPDFAGPNLWSTRFSTADGSTLALDIGWFLPDYPSSFMTLQGPGGFLRLDLATGAGELRIEGRVEPVQTGKLAQPWARQLDAFARSIDTGLSADCPVSRGWDALVATQACQQAARTNESVVIEG